MKILLFGLVCLDVGLYSKSGEVRVLLFVECLKFLFCLPINPRLFSLQVSVSWVVFKWTFLI